MRRLLLQSPPAFLLAAKLALDEAKRMLDLGTYGGLALFKLVDERVDGAACLVQLFLACPGGWPLASAYRSWHGAACQRPGNRHR